MSPYFKTFLLYSFAIGALVSIISCQPSGELEKNTAPIGNIPGGSDIPPGDDPGSGGPGGDSDGGDNPPPDTSIDQIRRISIGYDGKESGLGNYYKPSFSSDGKYVVLTSTVSNLVANDTNNAEDVFLFNTKTNQTQRVSIANDGIQANDNSRGSSISADGRYVVFTSKASNLVANDTNDVGDIFLFDTQAQINLQINPMKRISISNSGTQANGSSYSCSISSNGKYVVFNSSASNLVANDTNAKGDIFLFDTQTNQIKIISMGMNSQGANGSSYSPFISGDGTYIVFESSASNLVTDDTNGKGDIFLFYNTFFSTNPIKRISVSPDEKNTNDESFLPSISSDGTNINIVFSSNASNLIYYTGDTNQKEDIFLVHMEPTMTTTQTRISSGPNIANANNASSWPFISANGQYVVFESNASNLVSSDTNALNDIFLSDTNRFQIKRVSMGIDGHEANGNSSFSSISPDGKYIGFVSNASNLVANDTNNSPDLFLIPTSVVIK